MLVCGKCGSLYCRQTYTPRGEKYYIWRCLNRVENGKRICKHSPTFVEGGLQTAAIAAINEMFSQRRAKDAMWDSMLKLTEQDTSDYDSRMARVYEALEQDSGAISKYNDVIVCQLISNIKVNIR